MIKMIVKKDPWDPELLGCDFMGENHSTKATFTLNEDATGEEAITMFLKVAQLEGYKMDHIVKTMYEYAKEYADDQGMEIENEEEN